MTAETDAASNDAAVATSEPQATEMAPEKRHSAADHMVRSYALGAMAVALVPVPLVDLAGLVAVQLKPKPRRRQGG